ncbi:monooxygenase hypC [Colletotrichum spaethianum]|uniref:Monooxygenase hypC n=1 Tax=Colletotrichum spaethianum TaxID=700344 RepID=A0AA37UR03_9PEZI|nr:monooxygenase hypC [Colletotrichum spaethianum]GKT49802.1 monooxygenase hypC [Colletotrichum spaethianum]
MSSQPNPLRNILAPTVFANTALAGLNLSLSLFVIPRLLESPTPLMLRQFSHMLKGAGPFVPLPTLFCALSYWYMAYAVRHLPSKSRLLAAAGACCFTIVPWTGFFMTSINKKLFKKVEETKDMGIMAVGLSQEEEEGAKSLVDQWGLYNLGRGLAIGIGGAVGLYTVGL